MLNFDNHIIHRWQRKAFLEMCYLINFLSVMLHLREIVTEESLRGDMEATLGV
jgi:hypothetical protein